VLFDSHMDEAKAKGLAALLDDYCTVCAPHASTAPYKNGVPVLHATALNYVYDCLHLDRTLTGIVDASTI